MISVVIPTYNRPDSLKRTLNGIFKQTAIPAEVIIVDQTDRKDMLSEYEKTVDGFVKQGLNIIYRYLDVPSSSIARNFGGELANNEIILYMDDDVDLENDIFAKIESNMKDPDIALMAGFDRLAPEVKDSFASYIMGTKERKKSGTGYVTRSLLGRYPSLHGIKNEIPTEWAMGYFFVVRKSLLDRHGVKWDENLKGYAYAEDLDFSVRYCEFARENGYRSVISPDIVVEHLASKEYRAPSAENIYKYVANREYLYNKIYKNRFSRFYMYWTNLCMLTYRLLKRDKGIEMLKAVVSCIRYRKEIDRGIFRGI